jgi:hypothetical protein
MGKSSTLQKGFASPVIAIMISLFFILPAMIVLTNQSNTDFFYSRTAKERLNQQANFFGGAALSALRPGYLCSHNMSLLGGGLIGKDVKQINGIDFRPHLPSLGTGGPPLRNSDFTDNESLGFILKDVQLQSSFLEYVSTRSNTTALMKLTMTFGPRSTNQSSASISYSKKEEILMLVETNLAGQYQGNCIFTNTVDNAGSLLEDRVCQILKGPNTIFEMQNYACVNKGNAYGTVAAAQ